VAVISDGSDVRLYLDGELDSVHALHTYNPSSYNPSAYRFGNTVYWGNGAYSYPFVGVMDEVRISQEARSLQWLQTSYANQNAPGEFVSVGEVQVQ